MSTRRYEHCWGSILFSSDQSISHLRDAPLVSETDCEKVAKAAIEYALTVFGVQENQPPSAWQSSYLCVVEDAIVHHIDRALDAQETVGDFERELKRFIDQLGKVYHTAIPRTEPGSQTSVH